MTSHVRMNIYISLFTMTSHYIYLYISILYRILLKCIIQYSLFALINAEKTGVTKYSEYDFE